MKRLSISRLASDERLRELLYHIKGLIEAGDNLSQLATKLNNAYERDAVAFARTTSEIEVETFDHIGYHLKKLRRPLARLQKEAYGHLDESKINRSVNRKDSRRAKKSPSRR